MLYEFRSNGIKRIENTFILYYEVVTLQSKTDITQNYIKKQKSRTSKKWYDYRRC